MLIINGPVGVGKTTVGNEISNILLDRGIFHTLLDFDTLAETYPRPPGDRFGSRLALKNLRDVWTNCAASGSLNLVLPHVIEAEEDLIQIRRVVPNAIVTVCRLRASNTVLTARVSQREIGSGRNWHEARSLELAQILETSPYSDIIVDTDGRTVIDIATEIAGKVTWSELT